MKVRTRKTSKRKYTKSVKAGVTKDMFIMLQEIKVRTGKSKAAIIREALEDYDRSH